VRFLPPVERELNRYNRFAVDNRLNGKIFNALLLNAMLNVIIHIKHKAGDF
jgi:hypothetical protein